MDPFARHVTCRIRIFDESVNRLAEALSRPGVPGPGVAAGPFSERNIISALLCCMERDDPVYPCLRQQSDRISVRLDEICRRNGKRLRGGLIRDLRTVVDHYYSATCWRNLGIIVLPDYPGIRDRIEVLLDIIGDDPEAADLRHLVAYLDLLSAPQAGSAEETVPGSAGSGNAAVPVTGRRGTCTASAARSAKQISR